MARNPRIVYDPCSAYMPLLHLEVALLNPPVDRVSSWRSLLLGGAPGYLQPDHKCSYSRNTNWPILLKRLISGI